MTDLIPYPAARFGRRGAGRLGLSFLLLLAAPHANAAGHDEPPLVPRPASLTWQSGELPRDQIRSVSAGEFAAAARLLQRFADQLCGHPLQLAEPGTSAAITLSRTDEFSDAPEAYRLQVGPRGMHLHAADLRGMRYAALSAAQLLCWQQHAALPGLLIEDRPQFVWRGAMLDSARHFQSVDYIKRFLDAMALHKLNVLHWHLTDDQAWRIEIKSYPKLTDVGAWRVPAGAGQRDIEPSSGEARRYGGFYSQDQAREVIAYAAELGIDVVPEIDMPGHASAAIAAYPLLAAQTGAVDRVPADWGIYQNLFTLEEHGFDFLYQVLDEIAELFPSPYLHVGGDEVQPDQWLASVRGQALLRELPGTDSHRLQAWFTERVARHLEGRGKRLIGWDEILSPGLAQNAVVMSWRGTEGGIAAAQQGHDAILSPWPTLYFDNQQSTALDEPPGRLRTIDLATVYAFNPLPEALSPSQREHLLGIQGNVWTEHIRTEQRVSHMGFPRLAAVAELAWNKAERRDFDGFQQRLAGFWPHYATLGVEAADSLFAVGADIQTTGEDGQWRVALHSQTTLGQIRYRLDGGPVEASSPVYVDPIIVSADTELQVQRFHADQALGDPRKYAVRSDSSRARSSRELALCSENIALGLEDDEPVPGQRAIFALDIQNPCWRWPDVDLSQPLRLRAQVGQVPFNFQIGAAREQIQFPRPRYRGGELLVYAGHCEGEVLARLPLGSATQVEGISQLAAVNLPVQSSRTDLCFRFAQASLDPIWAIERLHLESR